MLNNKQTQQSRICLQHGGVIILSSLKMRATSSVTLTAVAQQSTQLVVCSPVNFAMISLVSEEKKGKVQQSQISPEVQSQPTSSSRQFLLVVTNWKSSWVCVAFVKSGGLDKLPHHSSTTSANIFSFEEDTSAFEKPSPGIANILLFLQVSLWSHKCSSWDFFLCLNSTE